MWAKLSHDAKSFVRKCLTRDAFMRPSAEDLLEHQWIKTNVEKPHLSDEQILDVNVAL